MSRAPRTTRRRARLLVSTDPRSRPSALSKEARASPSARGEFTSDTYPTRRALGKPLNGLAAAPTSWEKGDDESDSSRGWIRDATATPHEHVGQTAASVGRSSHRRLPLRQGRRGERNRRGARR